MSTIKVTYRFKDLDAVADYFRQKPRMIVRRRCARLAKRMRASMARRRSCGKALSICCATLS